MVLTLKRWKSRSSPGIAASERRAPIEVFTSMGAPGITHSQVKGLTLRGSPFGVFAGDGRDVTPNGSSGTARPSGRPSMGPVKVYFDGSPDARKAKAADAAVGA